MRSAGQQARRCANDLVFGGVGLVALLVWPGVTMAQVPDARARAEAQKLYEDGAKDLEADDYARACPKFEAAWKILPDHIRTGVTLADCLDKWGKPASALRVLEKMAPLAQARGDEAKTAEIQATIADLDKRVPRMTVRVSESLARRPGLSILRGETPLPPASWGTPEALDPGEYEVVVSAIDQPTWTTKIRLDMGKAASVEVEPGWPEIVVTPVGPLPPPFPSAQLRAAGFVGIGLGALGLGAWGVLGGLAISKDGAADAHCNEKNMCDREGVKLRNNAISLGNGASVGLVAGSVLATAGVALVVISVAGKKKSNAESPKASLWVGPSGAGVRGQW